MIITYDEDNGVVSLRKTSIKEEPYDSIHIEDLVEIWQKSKSDTSQTDMPKCRNGRYYKSCEYEDNCNPTVCFKALDEFQEAVTDCAWK